jgi:hypothetical protein
LTQGVCRVRSNHRPELPDSFALAGMTLREPSPGIRHRSLAVGIRSAERRVWFTPRSSHTIFKLPTGGSYGSLLSGLFGPGNGRRPHSEIKCGDRGWAANRPHSTRQVDTSEHVALNGPVRKPCRCCESFAEKQQTEQAFLGGPIAAMSRKDRAHLFSILDGSKRGLREFLLTKSIFALDNGAATLLTASSSVRTLEQAKGSLSARTDL